MPRWKITTQDEVNDLQPDRQVTIEAATLDEAAERAAAMMQPWEKVATVEPLPSSLPDQLGSTPA